MTPDGGSAGAACWRRLALPRIGLASWSSTAGSTADRSATGPRSQWLRSERSFPIDRDDRRGSVGANHVVDLAGEPGAR